MKESLFQAVRAVIEGGRDMGLFETAAGLLLERHLGHTLFPIAEAGPSPFNPLAFRDETVMILSTIAYMGDGIRTEREARPPFSEALACFRQWPPVGLMSPDILAPRALAEALVRLGRAPVSLKRTLLTAAVTAALYDRHVSDREYEVLAALAAALNVRTPLFESLHRGAGLAVQNA